MLRTAMKEHGDVLEYAAPKAASYRSGWSERRRRVCRGSWSSEARSMVQRCGDNQSILLRELEKLQLMRTATGQCRISTNLLPHGGCQHLDLLDSLCSGKRRGGLLGR